MKVRKIGIFNQLFIWLAILLLLGNGVLGIVVYRRSESILFHQVQINAKNIAQGAAAEISGDLLRKVTVGDEETKEYTDILHELSILRDNMELEYLYTLRQETSGDFIFVVDSDPREPADIGEVCETTDALLMAQSEGVTTVDDESFTDEWGTHLSAYSPIYDGQEIVGIAGVDISVSWIEEQLSQLRNLVLYICSGTYVISLIILQVIMMTFKRSIRKLNNKVEELAGGAGDLTKEIDIRTGDELEVIAENMNIFLRQIRSLIKEVSKSSEYIIVTGEELDQTVSSNSNIMYGMNLEISDISKNMDQSSSSSRMLSEDLSKNVEHIAAFAKEVNEIQRLVQEANKNAQSSSEMVEKNRKNALISLSAIREKMCKTAEDAQKIEQVKQIAQEISSIASQTNLLSLNAQIEAARAGEMGAGFAIVATEVGHLSNDIDQAVKQINMINGQVLTALSAMMTASDEMIRFVSEDVVRDYDAFANLGQEYGETTDFISDKMMEIGRQSTQISEKISDINKNIHDITNSVVLTAESAGKMAESAERVTKSLNSLKNISQKNVVHSTTLSKQVNKYTF